tara:strand:+ start:260 stop:1186 length:927 start_codon:yes stop_codon:yes gene_type:complete
MNQKKLFEAEDIIKKNNQDKEELKNKKIKEEEKLRIKFFESKVFGKTKHRIYNQSSSDLNKIKSESVHLAVTSPPYFNAKDYSQWDNIEDYLIDMENVFKEVFRTLRPGRKFCLNISDIPEKGNFGVKWLSLSSELLKISLNLGFELADRIFWFKTPLKGFNYGSLPYPPSPLINDSIENIFILRKPGKNDYSYVPKGKKEISKLPRDEYVEYTKQIWSIRRVRIKDNLEGHTAPFPKELPKRCIKLYSFVGDTILDPFGGSGTTSIAAAELKRNSIYVDINKDFSKLALNNLKSIDAPHIEPEIIYE